MNYPIKILKKDLTIRQLWLSRYRKFPLCDKDEVERLENEINELQQAISILDGNNRVVVPDMNNYLVKFVIPNTTKEQRVQLEEGVKEKSETYEQEQIRMSKEEWASGSRLDAIRMVRGLYYDMSLQMAYEYCRNNF